MGLFVHEQNLVILLAVTIILHHDMTAFSGVGHDQEADIDQLPDAVPCGVFKPVTCRGQPTYVVFDLETTDLSKFSFLYFK